MFNKTSAYIYLASAL